MVFEWMWRSPTQMSFKHKDGKCFHKRKEEALRARRRHPNMVPVVLEKFPGDTLDDLPKNKFLVPNTVTLTEFQFLVRKRIQSHITPETALFFFVNGNTLLSMSNTIQSIYDQHHHEDFILYMTYGKENAFGAFGDLDSS